MPSMGGKGSPQQIPGVQPLQGMIGSIGNPQMPQQPGYNMIGKQLPGMIGGKGNPQMPQQPGYNMIGKQLPGMIGGKGSPQMPGQQMPPGVMGDYMRQLKGQQMPQMPQPGQQIPFIPGVTGDYGPALGQQMPQPQLTQEQRQQILARQAQGMPQQPMSLANEGYRSIPAAPQAPMTQQDYQNAQNRMGQLFGMPTSAFSQFTSNAQAQQPRPMTMDIRPGDFGLASLGAIDPRMLP